MHRSKRTRRRSTPPPPKNKDDKVELQSEPIVHVVHVVHPPPPPPPPPPPCASSGCYAASVCHGYEHRRCVIQDLYHPPHPSPCMRFPAHSHHLYHPPPCMRPPPCSYYTRPPCVPPPCSNSLYMNPLAFRRQC